MTQQKLSADTLLLVADLGGVGPGHGDEAQRGDAGEHEGASDRVHHGVSWLLGVVARRPGWPLLRQAGYQSRSVV